MLTLRASATAIDENLRAVMFILDPSSRAFHVNKERKETRKTTKEW
jgi:hypothetical protein